jgi:glycerate 2-kinase
VVRSAAVPLTSSEPLDTPRVADLRADADAIVRAALRACDAHDLVRRALAAHSDLFSTPQPLDVIAAGKAAAAMMRAFTETLGARVGESLIVQGGHPLPNRESLEGGEQALAIAARTRRRGGTLVVLLSGGASAMLAVPVPGISLADKAEATKLLLRSGLPIASLNTVRKHISAVKGGRLGAAAEGSITLAISDVHAPVEDDPAVIGSGPTVADPSTFADAKRTLTDAGLFAAMPVSVQDCLNRGIAGEIDETIKPGDQRLLKSRYFVIGGRHDAMRGAGEEARARGYTVDQMEPPVLGEAADAARRFLEQSRHRLAHARRPYCLIQSGETTVTVTTNGRGGRNQEFALAAAPSLASLGVSVCASVGTDGIDGPTDAAGAFSDATTIARAQARGLDPARALREHDSYPFFAALGDLVVTGPTGTNVGDLQILLVE